MASRRRRSPWPTYLAWVALVLATGVLVTQAILSPWPRASTWRQLPTARECIANSQSATPYGTGTVEHAWCWPQPGEDGVFPCGANAVQSC
jgi:hypothetical protein